MMYIDNDGNEFELVQALPHEKDRPACDGCVFVNRGMSHITENCKLFNKYCSHKTRFIWKGGTLE